MQSRAALLRERDCGCDDVAREEEADARALAAGLEVLQRTADDAMQETKDMDINELAASLDDE